MTTASTRRAVLAGTGALSATIAASAAALAAAQPADADLLALCKPFDRTWKAYTSALAVYSAAEAAAWRRCDAEPHVDRDQIDVEAGLPAADKIVDRTERANRKVVERMCEIPARTMEGLVFKAKVSLRQEDNRFEELVTSIMDDILAMAGGANA